MDINPPWPKGKKVVHLDLKGAPPKLDYLCQLIECFSRMGVDGLLVEYEDMFPYEGELKLLQATAQRPYSRDEIIFMQKVAKSKGMEVIPLVQTFGHMEFVLKHPSMWSLREVSNCVGTLNPCKEEGLKLVMEMLRQVVALHPDLKTLHIGADEVYMLGEGELSKQWLASPGRSVEQLFLSHVASVVNYIKEAWPHMTIIVWDDMMRGMSQDTLKASGILGRVQPMLWDYTPNLDVEKTVSLLEKYYSAGMQHIWAASSFKGSTRVYTNVPSTQRHVDNHLQWLKVAQSVPSGLNIMGIALTGWQRYDHLSVLCELMPLALPSLAACLQTLIHGQFSPEAQKIVTELLDISSVEAGSMGSATGDVRLFPGRRLAESIVDLDSLLCLEDIKSFEKNMYVRGWFSPYQKSRRMVNPLISVQIQSQASMYLDLLQEKVNVVREGMRHIYPDSTAQEWMEEHVSPVMGPLKRILDEITECSMEIVPAQR
ncbi:hexosaminidase D [Corythoichthys intestinalis]|uniref:hexosaminidase D n=1 Tax=Corythoichthys intestinalis TaxID=161448 RepID=UPI0025A4D883|nr:hexosaminidase D [Corythoichthys intestinalis]XP_061807832.1 hexosaminidase D-like [Nerophis lumbriciformis]